MDFLISLFKSSAYVIIGITALFTAFFVILQLFIFLGKLFDIKSLYMPVVEIAEKATLGITGALKKFKLVFTAILLLLVFGFAYVDYEVVSIPIRFEKEKTKRYKAVIKRLKDIRTAQDTYKDAKGHYAKDFNTLLDFVKNDSLPIARNLGRYNEDTLTEDRALELGIILTQLPDTLTAERAVELGYVVRDTIKIPVAKNIFPQGFAIDSLRYVPYSGAEFALDAGEIMTGSGVKVQVFEAYDSQPFDKWDTLKVGSLTEANNGAGNWE